MKIVFRRIDEQRVCNKRVRVVAARVPLAECRAVEFYLCDVCSDACVPIQVLVENETIIPPGAAEEIAGVEQHDVVREEE